jgi:nucleotide-binding universal stress UspA family protein
MTKTVLVGTDASASAEYAVERALEEVTADGSLHAVFVVDTGMFDETALSSAELATDEIEDFGREQLADIAEQGEKLGIEVITRSCHGDPTDELVAYADDIDADLIVLGQQGQSNRGKNHIGSVTDRVLRSTDREVLLV